MEWSLQSRDLEAAVVPVAHELGVGIVAYSPLCRGFLTAIDFFDKLDENDWRRSLPRFASDTLEQSKAKVARFFEIAKEKNSIGSRLGQATAFQPKTLAVYLVSATAVSGGWFLYVWGVVASYIIETSLGYFMNPIFTVVIVVVLNEPLRPWQKVAVACAIGAILVVGIAYGKFPWLGVSLA
ncbi:hypothetical protein AC1031_003228 [Aphanomyces cochlioides]|nr:hypothetical protein AC1031_003228 [Aphanomyces cochlioides]